MKTTVKLITPEYANQLLERNTMNRFARPSLINEYARQMKNGLWKEDTGEAIKVATDGTILDGQHRLFALIKAECSLNFLIIEGLEKDVFPVLDSGSKRSSADVLHIAGVGSSAALAGGIRGYYYLRVGRALRNSGKVVSSSEIFTLYQTRSKFWDASANMAQNWYNASKRILTPGEIISYYAFFYDLDEDAAFYFMDSLSKGSGLRQDDPIFLLREKLIFAKVNPKFSLIPSVKNAFVFKAWNYFRDGVKIRQLRFDPARDNYPVAK